MASNAAPEGEQPTASNAVPVTAAAALAAGAQLDQDTEGNPNGPAPAPLPEGKMPTRKDASLKDFLAKMDDYAPIVRSQPPQLGPALDRLSYSALTKCWRTQC
jgi:hypothetical protein